MTINASNVNIGKLIASGSMGVNPTIAAAIRDRPKIVLPLFGLTVLIVKDSVTKI